MQGQRTPGRCEAAGTRPVVRQDSEGQARGGSTAPPSPVFLAEATRLILDAALEQRPACVACDPDGDEMRDDGKNANKTQFLRRAKQNRSPAGYENGMNGFAYRAFSIYISSHVDTAEKRG
jgi:hypothetical protein